jgi:tetratricopeptide (TPR) repeat protein
MAGLFDQLSVGLRFLNAAGRRRKGDLAESVAILEKLRSIMPSHSGVLISLAGAMIEQGRYDEAAGILAEAGAKAPDNPVVQQYLGIIGLLSGSIDEAEKHFVQAGELEPGNQLTRNYRDLCSIIKDDILKGIAGIKKDGIYSNTRLAGFLCVAVESLLVEPCVRSDEKGDGDAAEPSQVESTSAGQPPGGSEPPVSQQEPSSSAESVPTGTVSSEIGPGEPSPEGPSADDGSEPGGTSGDSISKTDEISDEGANPYSREPLLIRVLINPFIGLFYWFLGLQCLNRSKFEKAAGFFDRSALASPDTQRIHFYRGEAHFYNKEPGKALEAFRESYDADGENAEVLFYLGKIAQDEGRIDEAEQYLAKSHSLFPKAPETLYSLGQIMIGRGDREKARKYFEESAEYDFSYINERLDEAEKKLSASCPAEGAGEK